MQFHVYDMSRFPESLYEPLLVDSEGVSPNVQPRRVSLRVRLCLLWSQNLLIKTSSASSGKGGGHIPGRMMVLVSNIYYSMLFEIYMFTEEPYPNYTLIAHPSSLFWETWLWLDRQIIRHSQFHRKVLWNIFVWVVPTRTSSRLGGEHLSKILQ